MARKKGSKNKVKEVEIKDVIVKEVEVVKELTMLDYIKQDIVPEGINVKKLFVDDIHCAFYVIQYSSRNWYKELLNNGVKLTSSLKFKRHKGVPLSWAINDDFMLEEFLKKTTKFPDIKLYHSNFTSTDILESERYSRFYREYYVKRGFREKIENLYPGFYELEPVARLEKWLNFTIHNSKLFL